MADTELNLEAALEAVERRLPAMLEDAKYEWGEACGGPSEHEIYAQKILSAVRDEVSRAAVEEAEAAVEKINMAQAGVGERGRGYCAGWNDCVDAHAAPTHPSEAKAGEDA